MMLEQVDLESVVKSSTVLLSFSHRERVSLCAGLQSPEGTVSENVENWALSCTQEGR